MGNVKKLLVVFSLGCFLVHGFAGRASAWLSHAGALPGERNMTQQQDASRCCFHDAQAVRQEILSRIAENGALSDEERRRFREAVALQLEDCFDALSRLDYQALAHTLQSRDDGCGARAARLALHALRTVLPAAKHSEKTLSAGIGSATIVGLPYGLPVYVLSWIIYFIALEFQDVQPEIGLILFYVSGILSYLGLYFIL